MNTIIFEIPIYCCTPNEWQKLHDDFIQKNNDNLTHENQVGESDRFLRVKYGSWRYNFRIGYLTLEIHFNNIGIYESLTTSENISRKHPTKKPIDSTSHSNIGVYVKILEQKSNNDIYNEILSELEQYKTTYYLDLSIFKLIGPAIDWKSLKK